VGPYEVCGLCAVAVVVTVILAFVMAPRRKQGGVVDSDLRLWGPDLPGEHRYRAERPNISFEKIKREYDPPTAANAYHTAKGPTPFGKRTTEAARKLTTDLSFVPPTVHPTITLSPRQIERINIQRKLRNRPPFNRKGLANAVAHPWDRYDVRQPQNANDWISYLIAYQIIFPDHQANTVSGCQGINIDPNLPYNGHGGEYAGAGVAGQWGDTETRALAAAIDHGIGYVGEPAPGGAYNTQEPAVVIDRPDGPLVGDGPGAANAPGGGYLAPDYDGA
jgi:hypothetical protein